MTKSHKIITLDQLKLAEAKVRSFRKTRKDIRTVIDRMESQGVQQIPWNEINPVLQDVLFNWLGIVPANAAAEEDPVGKPATNAR